MGNTRTTNKWEIAYIQENGSVEGNIKKKPTSPVVYCTITTWFGVICSFLNLNNFLLKVMFYILWSFVSWENKNLQKNVCIFFILWHVCLIQVLLPDKSWLLRSSEEIRSSTKMTHIKKLSRPGNLFPVPFAVANHL